MGFRRWPAIFSVVGGGIASDNWLQSEPTNSPLDADERSKVTVDDVQRDTAAYLESTTAYSLHNKDKLVKPLKNQLAIMDINFVSFGSKVRGSHAMPRQTGTSECRSWTLNANQQTLN